LLHERAEVYEDEGISLARCDDIYCDDSLATAGRRDQYAVIEREQITDGTILFGCQLANKFRGDPRALAPLVGQYKSHTAILKQKLQLAKTSPGDA
jgi:hypothetical protein